MLLLLISEYQSAGRWRVLSLPCAAWERMARTLGV